MSAPATSLLYSPLAADPDLSDLVDLFVAEAPERIANLLAALDRSDWNEVGRLSHQLKGAAGSYGFDELSPVAAKLEWTVKSRLPEEEIRRAVVDVVEMSQRMRAGMPQ